MNDLQELKGRAERYLKAKFPQRSELSLVDVERLTGGYSYETYFLTLSWRESEQGLSEVLVLSMEPEHGVAPPYDVRPQYQVLSRISGQGIPAPRALFLESDPAVLGRRFFIMEKVQGESVDSYFPNHPAAQETLRKDYVEIITRLHGVDWRALNLSCLPAPRHDRDFAEREIERYESVMKASQFTPQPLMAEFFSWLKKNVPRSERTTLCHGDLKVGVAGNFFAHEGRISALLDWELVGIGDPVSDLGYVSLVLQNGLFWSKQDFLRAYEELSGFRVDEQSLFFWEVFTYVKWTVMGYPGFKSGLTSKDLNMRLVSTNAAILPWLKNEVAVKLGI